MNPLAQSGAAIRSAMIWMTISSGTSPPASMIALGLAPDGGAGLHGRAQHVAGRKLNETALFGDRLGLRSLACSGWPQQDQVHLRPRRSASELSFLDQAFVLVGKQVALDLRHGIHRDANRDQQRRAAEVERHGGVGNQKLRQHANGREVDGADDGNAGQDVVDVFGRLARPGGCPAGSRRTCAGCRRSPSG